MKLTIIGDSLLDRDWRGAVDGPCPDSSGPVVRLESEAVRGGGAALAARAAVALGADVTLVTALGTDTAGVLLADLLRRWGVTLVDLGLVGPTPEKIRLRSNDSTLARVDRGPRAAVRAAAWLPAAESAVASADAVLLSDYGFELVQEVEVGLAIARTEVPVVWDPLAGSRRPSARVDLATPSLDDVGVPSADDRGEPAAVASRLAHDWGCAIALTRGPDPIVVVTGDGLPRDVPCSSVAGDPCGAGDWFAVAACMALAEGESVDDAVARGRDAAGRWIAYDDQFAQPPELRPTVVATSGCFDVLHPGHLCTLHHAKSLGDRLVVLLNSDESVRRLKGRDRPVNGVSDRAALLSALRDVDEVRVFDEATACSALRALRPAIFVKGGDYTGVALPEAVVMAEWGGRVEIAPLVPGRSTTRVLRIASHIAG